MKCDPHAYTITIQKVQVDGDDFFESSIRELPDAAAYGETYQEAYELAIDAIETTAVMLEEAGREMPSPMAKHGDYSGRVTLRMSKSMHATTDFFAETDGVSLNSYITTAVAEKNGARSALSMVQEKINCMLLELRSKASQADSIIFLDSKQINSRFTDATSPPVTCKGCH